MTTRRWRVPALFVAFAMLVAACGDDDTTEADPASTSETDSADPFEPGVLASGATIATYAYDTVTVHTHTNPEAGFGNTTAVVETESSLVLVDTHFSDASASEFRAYAESFGKPIDRILISHAHPDHIGGLEEVFADIESYSSPGVIAEAAAQGITIGNEVPVGELVVDDVTLLVEVFEDAEAEEQIVVSIPSEGVVMIGDLVYSGYHAVMEPYFESWLAILDELAGREGNVLVIPGHGAVGEADAVIADMVDYLQTAQATYADSDDAETFNAALIEAYPDRLGANLLEFGSDRLFPKDS
ncbi:MAG: MBL fold metallo-hydrolase [Actinomycetota bacterium]